MNNNYNIISIYNKIIFKDDLKTNINILINRLNLFSLAIYLKNLTKDKRSLSQLAEIIKEEYNL